MAFGAAPDHSSVSGRLQDRWRGALARQEASLCMTAYQGCIHSVISGPPSATMLTDDSCRLRNLSSASSIGSASRSEPTDRRLAQTMS